MSHLSWGWVTSHEAESYLPLHHEPEILNAFQAGRDWAAQPGACMVWVSSKLRTSFIAFKTFVYF